MMEATILYIIGAFFMVVGAAMLLRPAYYEKTIKVLVANDSLMLVMNIINILLGSAILTVYHSWELNKFLIITLMGWGCVLKGIVPLFFPMWPKKKADMLLGHKASIWVWGVSLVVFGMIVFWMSWVK